MYFDRLPAGLFTGLYRVRDNFASEFFKFEMLSDPRVEQAVVTLPPDITIASWKMDACGL